MGRNPVDRADVRDLAARRPLFQLARIETGNRLPQLDVLAFEQRQMTLPDRLGNFLTGKPNQLLPASGNDPRFSPSSRRRTAYFQ